LASVLAVDSRSVPASDPIESALDVALIVMKNGGSTRMADRAFQNVLQGLGTGPICATWRVDFVAASVGSTTILRSVGPIGVSLVRAQGAATLAERVAKKELGSQEIATETWRLNRLPPLHSRWTILICTMIAASAFAQLGGGDWTASATAAVAAGCGQFFRPLLLARKLTVGITHLSCGIVSSLIAALSVRLGLTHATASTLIASVSYMIPGLPMINGFIDLISSGFLIVGLERIVNAAFLFLVLGVAITFALLVVI
jgi:uncharacterized membrane protein YjjP (DUF1212 family)